MIPYQIEIGSTGVVLGPSTEYRVARTQGLWGRSVDSNDVGRPASHGIFAGQDFVSSSINIIETNFGGGNGVTDGAATEVLMDTLSGAWAPGVDTYLRLCMRDGSIRRKYGRTRGFEGDETNMVRGYAEATCEFIGTDPRTYSDTLSSSSVAFPELNEGRAYNLTYPKTFGTTGAGGIIDAVNSGNAEVPWTARLNGPLVDPTIEAVGQGLTLSLVGSIETGEYLDIDSDLRLILLGGTASRYSWVTATSSWFGLLPGSNSIKLGGASGTGTLDFNWRSGWW